MTTVSLLNLRRTAPDTELDVTGPARLVRSARDVRRVRVGDVAVVDLPDLDRTTAEALRSRGAVAVVNVVPTSTGRYPNLGPQVLVGAGVPLLDAVGTDLFTRVKDGDKVGLDGATLVRGEDVLAEGTLLDDELVEQMLSRGRTGMSVQLETLAANSGEYLRREHALLLEGVGVPELATSLDGREVVVVLPGPQAASELKTMKRYLKERKPVLIGVDSGADALVTAGYDPAVVVGDMSQMSDRTLRVAGEVVVTESRRHLETEERLERLQRTAVEFPGTSGSEEAALLLSDARGARVVVTVGGFGSLDEFLDSARSGGATRYLTRLRLGAKLVDARAMVGLHRPRFTLFQVLLVLFVAMVALGAALATTAVGAEWFESARDQITSTVQEIRG
ncbi:putative cytokinetic ring protein SteA [Mumia sp. ZJ430]|uniref:putative cytokinetic ring protein SteA n=1 Tax=Mumia sp. ZJ430 TaxID=2708083 RepID=UPI001423B540|nr:putative cytokinetic ring protein SteA [Mumia sp. ZJ430]